MFTQIIRFVTIVAAAFGFYLITVVNAKQQEKNLQSAGEPLKAPAQKPYADAVAATGLIEALSENVAIGSPIAGLITDLFVTVNSPVKKGQPLFKLDDRELRAEETGRRADIEVAKAQIAVAEAQQAKADLQFNRLDSLKGTGAVSKDVTETRQSDAQVAASQVLAAKAQLVSAEAALQRLQLLIDRLTVLSPRDGTILQVNTRAGEYAATSPKNPAVIVGDLNRFQIRADVDEQNATRIREGQKAKAHLKGDPKVTFDLEFSRIEPYVIPKVSLTGASTERVDTRVLQVIYTFVRPADAPPLYVGQQVDVFIEAAQP
ncbi:MAG: Secretion protein HlyD [Akkermansiaceae bacterium]|nr:Secretion protein HlyD [Akkermansiaceae bacterium]